MGADPISAGMGLGASIFGANATSSAAEMQAKSAKEQALYGLQGTREQIAEQGRQFNVNTSVNTALSGARQKAYEDAIKRGEVQMGQGEKGFMSSVDTASPELGQLKQDILSGRSEAINTAGREMQSKLAQGGVRGGQAATLLNRGVGQMGIESQRDINQLMGTEAMQREAEKRAYLAAKAQRGQTATLPNLGVTF